jgi:hypothetical protein
MVVDIKLEACLVQTLPHRRESVETFQTPPWKTMFSGQMVQHTLLERPFMFFSKTIDFLQGFCKRHIADMPKEVWGIWECGSGCFSKYFSLGNILK